jgi:nitroreductase
MDLMEVIRSRRSVRKYRPDPVDAGAVEACLEAARLAPSWANTQSWRFVVVTDPAAREVMAGERAWMLEAPLIVAVCSDTVNCGKKEDLQYFMLDAGIAMEHFVLAAAERGLGTCWIGWFDEAAVNRALSCPAGVRCVALTPVGWPVEKPGPITNRKPVEEIVFHERYGQR